jgi:preprotein translocase subunit SecF
MLFRTKTTGSGEHYLPQEYLIQRNNMFIVRYRKIFYAIAILLSIVSIGALSVWGLSLGIDFKGGSLLEISYATSTPSLEVVRNTVEPLGVDATVREAGTASYIIRMKDLTDPEKANVETALTKAAPGYKLERFTAIGPVLGAEAAHKSVTSIIMVLICIVLFVTFAFRKVSEPVSSWKYGLITVVALFHDVIVPAGVFAFLGHFMGVQVDTLFVTALLVVLGFSVHDTIVVFDRVREHLKNQNDNKIIKSFDVTVGESVSETYTRSINTSLTTLFALAVLFVLGGEATRYFSLALLIGITAGTYSSIFLASPLLVTVQKWQEKKALKAKK